MAFGPQPWHFARTATALTRAFEKLRMTHADSAFAREPCRGFALLPPQEYIRSLDLIGNSSAVRPRGRPLPSYFRLPFAPPLALPSLYICAFIPLNYIVSALHASLRASLRTSLYISLRRIASRPVATLTRPSPPWLEAKAKVVKIHTKLHNTQRPARHIDKLQRYTSSKPETWVGLYIGIVFPCV